VALIKEISIFFGPIGGAALMYTLASIFLLFTFGWTRLKDFPIRYLWIGGILFVSYEIALSLSIGYSTTSRQAIEVGMINYLWPTFVIIFAIIFNKQKANFLIIPGFCLSILGISWVLSGAQGFSPQGMLHNIKENPLSYGLAFLGSILWAAYCTITTRIAAGKNGISLFFILVSLVLWVKWFFSGEMAFHFEIQSTLYLFLAAAAMGIGYGAWNIGILHGNVTLLAAASYFTPVFSAVVSAILLNTHLGLSFWQGALMVSVGALLCWISTKVKTQ